jgi:hypothetical protein
MDEVESRLAAIFGLSRDGNLPDFFDAISPILNQNESLVSKDMRAATAATANFLRLIEKKLSKFDLGKEWVQETKLQSNESLLQAAYSSFSTVTSQRFCVTNRASTGDDGDGRYFYLAATVTNLGHNSVQNNDFIILVTMVTMVTQISLPQAAEERNAQWLIF